MDWEDHFQYVDKQAPATDEDIACLHEPVHSR
jgi:hypothetical protein